MALGMQYLIILREIVKHAASVEQIHHFGATHAYFVLVLLDAKRNEIQYVLFLFAHNKAISIANLQIKTQSALF
jgi:hypothetical protein